MSIPYAEDKRVGTCKTTLFMKFLFSLIQVTKPNAGYLNARIHVYFSITVCTFLYLHACISYYFFPLCFIHVFDQCIMVQNSYSYPLAVVLDIHQIFLPNSMYDSSFWCSTSMECHRSSLSTRPIIISTVNEMLPYFCKHFLCKLFCVSWCFVTQQPNTFLPCFNV